MRHRSPTDKWPAISYKTYFRVRNKMNTYANSECVHKIKERKEKRASCSKRGKVVMFVIKLYRMTAGIVEDDSVYHVLSCSAL